MKYITHPISIITIVYILVNTFVFQTFGVKVVNDTGRYLEYANNLKSGIYFHPHNFWYLGYVLFIFFIQLATDSLEVVVFVQYFLGLLSVYALYHTYNLICGPSKGAIVLPILYILFFEIQIWHSYLLCESLYSSFICFTIYSLARLHVKPNVSNLALALLFTAFTFMIKPTGIAMLVAVAFVLIYKLSTKINRFQKYLVSTISLLVFLVLVNKMLTTFIIIENYMLGEVIYGVSTLKLRPEFNTLLLNVPDDLIIPEHNQSNLLRIIIFIVSNPLYFAKLFLYKVFYFTVHIRPFWSVSHNLYVLAILVPVYFFFIKALFKSNIDNEIRLFTGIFMLIQIIAIGLTSVDWDGRFLMPMLPMVFLLSSIEFNQFVKNLASRQAIKS